MKRKEHIEVTSREKHFLIKECPCGHVFAPRERFTLITTENGWFRGEDDVVVKCQNCRKI